MRSNGMLRRRNSSAGSLLATRSNNALLYGLGGLVAVVLLGLTWYHTSAMSGSYSMRSGDSLLRRRSLGGNRQPADNGESVASDALFNVPISNVKIPWLRREGKALPDVDDKDGPMSEEKNPVNTEGINQSDEQAKDAMTLRPPTARRSQFAQHLTEEELEEVQQQSAEIRAAVRQIVESIDPSNPNLQSFASEDPVDVAGNGLRVLFSSGEEHFVPSSNAVLASKIPSSQATAVAGIVVTPLNKKRRKKRVFASPRPSPGHVDAATSLGDEFNDDATIPGDTKPPAGSENAFTVAAGESVRIPRTVTDTEAYLRKLFGMASCKGCRYVSSILKEYKLEAGQKALDVGTGGCGVVRKLAGAGWNVRGVEALEPPLKERCNELLEKGDVQVAPLDKIPYADGSFDVVMSLHVLEHLPDALQASKLRAVIRELARLSSMHVIVAITVSSKHHKLTPEEVEGINLHSEMWWSDTLEENGLAISASRTRSLQIQYKKAYPSRQNDAIYALVSKLQAGLDSWGARECMGCHYLSLVEELYAADLRSGHIKRALVTGAGTCRLVQDAQGLLATRVVQVSALERSMQRIEADCPEEKKEGLIAAYDQGIKGIPDNSIELVLSINDLEYLPEEKVAEAIADLARVAKRHVFIVVATCGIKRLTDGCAALKVEGIQTLQTRAWWLRHFKEAKLETVFFADVFETRGCNDGKLCNSRFDTIAGDSATPMHESDVFTLRAPGSGATGEVSSSTTAAAA